MYSTKHYEVTHYCRLCNAELPVASVLAMSPFPKAAQHFLNSNTEADSAIEIEIFQCQKCSLIQLKSIPVPYYKSVITAASLSEMSRNSRYKEISIFYEQFGIKNARAIEIGCGKGSMLDIIKRDEITAHGLEFEQDFVNEALTFGRQVHQGYINDFIPELKYNVFFCFNFLEHQPDISEFISHISRITEESAFGYITVPNLSYLLDTKSYYEFVPDHLVYFTEATLKTAFEINGFDVLTCSTINNDNDILLTVKKRCHLLIGDKYSIVNELIHVMQDTVKRHVDEGEKVAVWGAGHRTLALLSLSQLKNISYIIDSAPFKHGKFSPVILTPIISPEDFAMMDIDVIIIAVPGIYPQEVLKKVLSFEKKYTIYSLENNRLVHLSSECKK